MEACNASGDNLFLAWMESIVNESVGATATSSVSFGENMVSLDTTVVSVCPNKLLKIKNMQHVKKNFRRKKYKQCDKYIFFFKVCSELSKFVIFVLDFNNFAKI